MKEKSLISNNFVRKEQDIFNDYEEDSKTNMNIPITNPSGGPTMFVNAKQYLAIQRRRIKKMNNMKKQNFIKIKTRIKYQKRSQHARNRKRTNDGKFTGHCESNLFELWPRESMDKSKDTCKTSIEKSGD